MLSLLSPRFLLKRSRSASSGVRRLGPRGLGPAAELHYARTNLCSVERPKEAARALCPPIAYRLPVLRGGGGGGRVPPPQSLGTSSAQRCLVHVLPPDPSKLASLNEAEVEPGGLEPGSTDEKACQTDRTDSEGSTAAASKPSSWILPPTSQNNVSPVSAAGSSLSALPLSAGQAAHIASSQGAEFAAASNTDLIVNETSNAAAALTPIGPVTADDVSASWGAPQSWLSNRYNDRLGRGTVSGKNFVLRSKDSGTWHTATYVCPVTGEEFNSGFLRVEDGDEQRLTSRIEGNRPLPRDLLGVKVFTEYDVDGNEVSRVYYKRKPWAKNAAAACAIDCFFSRTRQNRTDFSEDLLDTKDATIQLCRPADQTPTGDVTATPTGDVTATPIGHVTADDLSASWFDPQSTLFNMYQKKLGIGIVSGKSVSIHSKDSGTWHTATFACPVTGEEFNSGFFRVEEGDEQRIKEKIKGEHSWARPMPNDLSGVKVFTEYDVDGNEVSRVYYKRVGWAKNAAAARAMDCFFYRSSRAGRGLPGEGGQEGADSIIEQRLCLEDPYLSPDDEGQKPKKIEYGVLMDSQAPGIRDKDAPSTAKGPTTARTINHLHLGLGTGLEPMATVIPAECGDESDDSETFDFVNVPSASTKFTVDSKEDEEYTIQHLTGTTLSHGSTESTTEDTLSTQPTTMERILEAWADVPRLNPGPLSSFSHSIVDDPSTHDKNEGTSLQAQVGGRPQLLVNPESEREEAITNALAWYRRMEHGIKGAKKDMSCSATLTAGGNGRATESESTSSNIQQAPVSVFSCNAILNALGNANTISNYIDGIKDVSDSCNSKLDMNVESIAKQILDRMLSSTGDSHQSSRLPNTGTFNAYIRCLRRSDPIETAMAAEQLLNDMVSGGTFAGQKLPPANIETYNAVLACWSAVRGPAGHKKANELYTKLEMEMAADCTGVRPNRETFRAALSTIAGSGEPFCPDEARRWIDRMEQLAGRFDDSSMIPTTDIYNAPLRWSGARDAMVSAAILPWDDHAAIFADGFRHVPSTDKKDQLVTEAENITQWLLYMEEQSTESGRRDAAPDIRTYESVIQAWVRTGTFDGVVRAERWASRAIEAANSIYPRLQTFHPIIAAWAHCGSDVGPTRVKKWITSLEELSKTMPDVKPDGRVRAALILAYRQLQLAHGVSEGGNAAASALDKVRVGGDDPMQSSVNGLTTASDVSSIEREDRLSTAASKSLTAAKHCNKYLKEICSQVKAQGPNEGEPQIYVDGSTFCHVVNAWADAALALARSPGRKYEGFSPDSAFSEMMNVVQLLDDTVDHHQLHENEQRHEDDDFDADTVSESGHRHQLLHLLHASTLVYGVAISHLLRVDESTKGPSYATTGSFFAKNFPRVETMIRRTEELGFFIKSYQSQRASNLANAWEGDESFMSTTDRGGEDLCNRLVLNYPDLYCYNQRGVSSLDAGYFYQQNNFDEMSMRQHLYLDTLKGCRYMDSACDYGHAVRLAMFILKHTAVGRFGEKTIDVSNLYLDVIHLIGDVVGNVHDRRALLAEVHNDSKQHFPDQIPVPQATVDRDKILQALNAAHLNSGVEETLQNEVETQRKRSKGIWKKRARSRRRLKKV